MFSETVDSEPGQSKNREEDNEEGKLTIEILQFEVPQKRGFKNLKIHK